MNNLDNLTLVILTYKTGKKILDNCLSSIDKNIKIIVVENSTYFENQKYFEDKYKNIKIILTEKNLGYAGGNNFGLNISVRLSSPTPFLFEGFQNNRGL